MKLRLLVELPLTAIKMLSLLMYLVVLLSRLRIRRWLAVRATRKELVRHGIKKHYARTVSDILVPKITIPSFMYYVQREGEIRE